VQPDADSRRPREEEMTDERYLRRHQPHVLAEQRYRKWGSHTTRFALDMSLRLERERLKWVSPPLPLRPLLLPLPVVWSACSTGHNTPSHATMLLP